MISIIVATTEEYVIGKDNKLLWHIPEDLKRFKEITNEHIIFMGRKTFESLPGILPNRHHVVLTRNKDFSVNSDMVSVVNSIDDFVKKYENSEEEVFVIGGAEIYNLLLNYTKKIYLTRVYKSFDGDTIFPKVDYSKYSLEYQSKIMYSEKGKTLYSFLNFVRK